MAPTRRRGRGRSPLPLPTILLLVLLACLAVAGGASRADALGQAIVRVAAGVVIAALIAAGAMPQWHRHRGPVLILLATAALVLVQLVPLPPALWSALPGRAPFLDAAAVAGAAQPWRPIAISPDLAWNALFSLLVPAAALMLAMALDPAARARVPLMVAALAAASALVALLQLSGGVDNPLINERAGTPSGLLANANHQALLLAVGIVATGAWAADGGGHGRPAVWRLPVAGGASVWFLLMILASGSRTGLVLGFAALVVAGAIARRAIAHSLRRVPLGARWGLAAVVLAGGAALAVASFTAGRAVSLNRLLVLSTGEDMRTRALPTVLDMIGTYLPFGSGFGGFAALFRMHEPDALLKLTYFNHAHSDYLEVALDGGVAGLMLVAVALVWIARAAVAAWRRDPAAADTPVARFGAAALVLVAAASAVDYPARTPLVMALVALAAVLADPGPRALRSAAERV